MTEKNVLLVLSRDRIRRTCRRMPVKVVVIAFVAFSLIPFNQGVYASPVIKVLFGSEDCTFLPKRPAPAWISDRPPTNDYVGISSASNPDRKLNPTQQIQAAEQNARGALAAEISVSVHETTTQFMEERYGSTATEVNREIVTQVSLEATQVIDQTLSGSRITERYLDHQNCVVHVMALISRAEVEEARKQLAEKLRKLFRFKHLMLLDRSDAHGEMANATRGYLDALFKQTGTKLVAADSNHAICVDDPSQLVCQTPADTIYAGYKVVLDQEGSAAGYKRRIYKLTGNVRFRDRVIASFDVSCQARGKVTQDHLIDQQAAKDCYEQAKPRIEKGMEGSE